MAKAIFIGMRSLTPAGSIVSIKVRRTVLYIGSSV